MRSEMVVSISSVIARIKNVLTQTMDLDGIWIQGEISNLTKHRSGHYYFSLKDKSGEMSCVMFSSYVSRLNFNAKRYRSNLINWGMLPFLIPEGELPFKNKDYIFVPQIRQAVEEKWDEIKAYAVGEV